ncbi:DUF4145 domain-containing protein [Maridesulfovibrio zosterae]|uniref:DUF4145 domain-containing protein n=1 Tax=Maridesulfovibrio zosterae TaxID=82171 RepID=UPI0004121B20|nr:DUF4145 domain-containing protein [Maridesulfovibrio zosterae]
MNLKNKVAAITENSFNCPHCEVFSIQHWERVFIKKNNEVNIFSKFDEESFLPHSDLIKIFPKSNSEMNHAVDPLHEFIKKTNSGLVFYQKTSKSEFCVTTIENLYISKCFACKKIAIWAHDKLVYPAQKYQVEANSDLPDDILVDFEEARAIVDDSPRGAAALLRLAIQKLCKHLGKPGKKINDDIASLVNDGLSPKIQQALDLVRVVGNDAVHPGELNLNDNKAIAYKLFDFVNIIAEEMISRPKEIEDLYNGLPASKLEGIEKRDNGKKK